jgi:4-aminobutyrate aminotransferase/(S)-3-amino-2-methylpropionate transaminase
MAQAGAPMGPRAFGNLSAVKSPARAGTIVLSTGRGSNVTDVDGNRYVDLAQGFGSLLLGHNHQRVLEVLNLQAARLVQALGDVHPADAKIGLMTRLAEGFPEPAAVIVGQSGSDAVTAALKTAALYTGRPGVIAFEGAYHGLGYGPLAACGLRASYRAPFSDQLNPHVSFATYPSSAGDLPQVFQQVRAALSEGTVGAILAEPILGRGGVVVPPGGFFDQLSALAHDHGALLVADEIWTGLGRAGEMLLSVSGDTCPDLVLLGKGLGGGLPISVCIGKKSVLEAWSREDEVVHTSTFAGAPLACATALGLLDVLSKQSLVERSRNVGARWLAKMEQALASSGAVRQVRGRGLMIGIELGERVPGGASTLSQALLERGYLTTTGGGGREVLVLTPALNIEEALLDEFSEVLSSTLRLLST